MGKLVVGLTMTMIGFLVGSLVLPLRMSLFANTLIDSSE